MTLPKDPVLVVSKATGRKQYVPRHFLTNPALSGGFEVPPSLQQPDPGVDVEPDDDADEHDLDVADDIQELDPPEDLQDLDHLTSDDIESSDETPA